MTSKTLLGKALCLSSLLLFTTFGSAAALETLHTFEGAIQSPRFLVRMSNGDLYGSAGNLDHGNDLFRLYQQSTNGPWQLEWKNIRFIDGILEASDGALYLTAVHSIDYPYGAILKLQGTNVSTLYSFSNTGPRQPGGSLIEASDGNFYGTTGSFDGSNYGTIFRITPSGAFTTLHVFDWTNGSYPQGGLIQASDGCLYGTTYEGGTLIPNYGGGGTVFKITTNGIFTSLHHFDGTGGVGPLGGLVEGQDGNFYGTTEYGGDVGYFFGMTPSGTITTMRPFSPNLLIGSHPRHRLVEGTNGIFYGVTSFGGPLREQGSVFKVTADGIFTLLHGFEGVFWWSEMPITGLVMDDEGYFYGTTSETQIEDGISEPVPVNGTIFRFKDEPGSDLPGFLRQPQDVSTRAGNTVSLSVVPTGLQPVGYQWQKAGVNLVDSGRLSGTTNRTFTITAAEGTDSGQYTVVVTNSVGSITSAVAVVTIQDPAIATQPASRTNAFGSSATFTVTASGSGTLTYQWSKDGVAINDTATISGAQTATLSLTNISHGDAGLYAVTVSNGIGSIQSTNAGLVILDPGIQTQPLSKTVVWGMSTTFSVSAAGTGPFTYQWMKSGVALTNDGNVSGATTSTLTLSGVTSDSAGSYSVVVSNGSGSTTSSPAWLTVSLTTSILTQPANCTNVAGSTATFTVNATSDAPLYYRWMKGTVQNNAYSGVFLTDSSKYSGTHSSTLTINNVNLTDAGTYLVLIGTSPSNMFYAPSWPGTARSDTASLTVLSVPTISQHPTSRTIILGSSTALSVTASGAVTYQWHKNGIAISGATTPVLSITNAQFSDSGSYGVTVTGPEASVTFGPVQVTVIRPTALYNGLFHEADAVRHETAGFITLKTTGTNFSGKIMLEGLASGFTGKLAADGTGTKAIVRTNFARENLTLNFAIDSLNEQITGTISNSQFSAVLTADYYPYSISNQATLWMSTNTLALPGFSNGSEGPIGSSCASVTVNSLGKVRLTGGLADGQNFAGAVTISAGGTFPVYTPAYPVGVTNHLGRIRKEYRGSVLGWLTITNNAPNGTLSWIKTGWTNALYSGGFTNEQDIIGSRYNYVAGTRVMEMTNGLLTFSGGNLVEPFSANVLLKTNNILSATLPQTNKAVVSLAPKTGLYSGSFRHPENTNIVTKLRGVILQQQNYGTGFFAGTNHNGSVVITAQ